MLRPVHAAPLCWGGLILSFGLTAAAIGAPDETFTNPLAGGADPWVIQWEGQYFYTRTTGSDVRLSRAPYLQDIVSNTRVVWDPPTNTAYGQNLWAPELHRLNDKWYMYVAADDGRDANHRMYVLEGNSQDPQGTYTFKGQISIPDNRWAIDGTVFSHQDKDYFIWSGRTNSNDAGGSQSLYIAEMENPWTLSGTRTRISSPQYNWERHGHPVNEAPQILTHGDDVFLTYSASGFYTEQYALGMLQLTGSDVLNASSWIKKPQPIFQAGNGVEGTGHASFTKSPDGTEDWLVYHGRLQGQDNRQLFIQPFTFGTDGLPALGAPLPPSEAMPAPSGTPLVTFIPNGAFDRTDVTVNSNVGRASGIERFNTYGDVGVISNTGRYFDKIEGGDGPQVAYLGNGHGALWQNIGPIHEGIYNFSVGFALSSDELEAAAADPQSFRFFLQSVAVRPDGSLNEGDKLILAEMDVSSLDLMGDVFTYFDLDAIIDDPALSGSMLRVWIGRNGEAGDNLWSVKLDNLQLTHTAIPEPAGFAFLALSATGGLLRRKR